MAVLLSLQQDTKKKEEIKQAKEELSEWNLNKKWNPFNSYKLLAHVDRWKQISRGKSLPPPILVTVDPTNNCNFNCSWCNSAFIRKKNKNSLSKRALLNLADFLPKWRDNSNGYKYGVKATCIAGGGEPLLNPAIGSFINRLVDNGIQVGVVTNGSLMSNYIDCLSHCTWVGVSIDAATSETFNKLKGLNPKKRYFENVIENIVKLVDYAKRNNYRLGLKHPAYGVSFKYLLYKDNIGEIFQAAKLAKDIGCKNIHIRPAGTPWNRIGTDEISFSEDQISLFNEQITKALELDDETFGVYGITHKFNPKFGKANYFEKCYAIFMTAVIEPPFGINCSRDSFVVGLCCDRRGDKKLELARNITDVEEIKKLWGSNKHWKIHDEINHLLECPRCTYKPHNEIYEQVILNDSMTYDFI